MDWYSIWVLCLPYLKKQLTQSIKNIINYFRISFLHICFYYGKLSTTDFIAIMEFFSSTVRAIGIITIGKIRSTVQSIRLLQLLGIKFIKPNGDTLFYYIGTIHNHYRKWIRSAFLRMDYYYLFYPLITYTALISFCC